MVRQLHGFRLFAAFVFCLWQCTVFAAAAEVLRGKVVGVQDGDTLTLLLPNKTSIRVRLFGIDAPESRQAFGQRSKQELSSLVFGKEVEVVVTSLDRYGRHVGQVRRGDINVNEEMVKRGMAWWYRSFSKKDRALSDAEESARSEGRGLWADNQPTPPWEWRRTPTKKSVIAE